MIALMTKALSWTAEGNVAIERLKALANNCPKLYFIDCQLPVIIYTDASDYAHEAYLCQLRIGPDCTTIEDPIWFLVGPDTVVDH